MERVKEKNYSQKDRHSNDTNVDDEKRDISDFSYFGRKKQILTILIKIDRKSETYYINT